jgi:septal ring factor EnvC (AmiA/AmiB activator)
MKATVIGCLVLLGVLASTMAETANARDGDPEAELEGLRKRIESLQSELERDADRKRKESARLRAEDKRVSAAANLLAETKNQLAASKSRQRAMLAERETLADRLGMHRDVLSAQARAAYIGGRHQRLKLALNQQDPATLGRMMVYYRYLSENRAQSIAEVSDELERLAEIELGLAAEARELEKLEESRAQELGDLESARAQRRELIASIDQDLKRRGDEMGRLQQDQKDLEKLIEELQKALAELPGTSREPFAEQRGKLAWPVAGRLLSDFGQPRAGGSLKWNGVLVGTERGAEVRAVYHGRVAYADWLPGLGLLTVVEHGDGYISLYGHNETLFRNVGEWVQPGDVLATTGDSGGRSGSALYFEIRKGARPQDPHRWFGSRLTAR